MLVETLLALEEYHATSAGKGIQGCDLVAIGVSDRAVHEPGIGYGADGSQEGIPHDQSYSRLGGFSRDTLGFLIEAVEGFFRYGDGICCSAVCAATRWM